MAIGTTPKDEAPPARVTFFFGAGASKKAGVPLTREFVTEFRGSIAGESQLVTVYDRLVALLNEEERPDTEPVAIADVEALLSSLDTLAAPPLPIRAFFNKKELASGFDQAVLIRLRRDLESFIREKCVVLPEATGYLQPFLKFLKDWGTIRVFTTNYDIVLEQFFRISEVRWTDGFRLSWDSSELTERSSIQAYIYKLQGSVTWFHTPLDGFVSLPIVRGVEGVQLLSGETPVSVILYPARKEGFAGPLVELMRMLQEELLKSDILVVVGYSFRDERFLRIFLDAGAAHRDLRLVLISPDADTLYSATFRPLREGGEANATSNGRSSVFEGRVLRLPLQFESCFWELVNWFLPTYVGAMRKADTNLHELAAGQAVDWKDVAVDLASVGLVDDLDDLESAAPLFGGDVFAETRYAGIKSLALALHGLGPRAEQEWRKMVESIRLWLSRETPVSIYQQGGAEIRVRPNLGYPVHEGERSYEMGINFKQFLSLLGDLRWFTTVYGGATSDPLIKERFERIKIALSKFQEYCAALKDDVGQGHLLESYLEIRSASAAPEVSAIHESIGEHGPLRASTPINPTAMLIFELERRLYQACCDALQIAMEGSLTRQSSSTGTFPVGQEPTGTRTPSQ
jgi:hypothetical protein